MRALNELKAVVGGATLMMILMKRKTMTYLMMTMIFWSTMTYLLTTMTKRRQVVHLMTEKLTDLEKAEIPNGKVVRHLRL